MIWHGVSLLENSPHATSGEHEDDNQRRHLEEPAEAHRIAEEQRNEFKYQEFATWKHEKKRAYADDTCRNILRAANSFDDFALHPQHDFKNGFEEDRGQKGEEKRFGNHLWEQLGERAQNHEVDEDIHEINRLDSQRAIVPTSILGSSKEKRLFTDEGVAVDGGVGASVPG